MKPSDQGTLALLRTAIVRGKAPKKEGFDPQSYYERRQEALRNHKI